MIEANDLVIICKCCGEPARWCGEGVNACSTNDCDHIHCDHCGMHYSLESKESASVQTMEEAKEVMLTIYNHTVVEDRNQWLQRHRTHNLITWIIIITMFTLGFATMIVVGAR